MIGQPRALSPTILNVFAVACISFAALSRPPMLAAAGAGIGLVLFTWSLLKRRPMVDRHSFRWAGLSVIVILGVRFSGSVGRLTESEGVARPIWFGFLVLASVLAIVMGHRLVARRLSVVLALLAVTFVTGVMTVQEWRADLGLDVYWMHRAAGEALFTGENPYTAAVTVSDGSPFAPEGAVIEGYPYPPVVLGTYGVAGAASDPRIISALAWIGLLAWMAWRAWKPRSDSNSAYSMFLLLAGLAVWPVVWFASWTEPLSVALIVLVAVWWRRRPTLSAVALGLAIASKQYFVFLAPLLLLHRDDSKRKRLMVAFSVAALTLLVGVLPDPSAFVTSTVANLSEIGFRPDTQSLSGGLRSLGVEFYLSPFAWVAAGLALSAIVAIGSTRMSDLIGRVGLVLGLVFFIGQAFPNYWFITLAVIAVAEVVADDEGSDAGELDRTRLTIGSSANGANEG